MPATTGSSVRASTARRARRLRFPTLFALAALLFLVDLLVPDFLPFIDEIILGLVTVMLGMMREKRVPDAPPPAERVD